MSDLQFWQISSWISSFFSMCWFFRCEGRKNATSAYLSCCRDCSLPLKMLGRGSAVSTQEWVSNHGHGFQRQYPMGLLDQENYFLNSSLDQLWMDKIIICWICLGLASIWAVQRAFPTTPLQEDLDGEQVVHISQSPAELKEAVRKENWKASPYFIPAAIMQINQ